MAKKSRSKKVKEKKESIKKVQSRLWVLCKLLTRKKYANPDGSWDCYTCNRNITYGGDAHTAHMIPKGACGASLRYDLRNIRVCCYHCNINLGGNGANFVRNMIIREGQEYVDSIFADRALIIKAYDHYQMLSEKYKLMLEDLNAQHV